MDGKISCSTTTTTFFILLLFITPSLFQGSRSTKQIQKPEHGEKQTQFQKDITTPITTVPTVIPIPTTPIEIPTAMTNPGMNPIPRATTTSVGGSSWCIASQSADQISLQMGLDYACGIGGADCGEIQMGRSCFNPNSVRDHASYAFNSYYQNNPLPNSCNFGGIAVITSTNPSTATCQYPSTSTSSSILNTTNSYGSTVFGAVPTHPSTSSSPNSNQLDSSFQSSLILFITLSLFFFYS